MLRFITVIGSTTALFGGCRCGTITALDMESHWWVVGQCLVSCGVVRTTTDNGDPPRTFLFFWACLTRAMSVGRVSGRYVSMGYVSGGDVSRG